MQTQRQDIGKYPGSKEFPPDSMEQLVASGYWTRVIKQEVPSMSTACMASALGLCSVRSVALQRIAAQRRRLC